MNVRNILLPLAAAGLLGFGFVAYGWPGVVAVLGGLVMWGLLHFTRLVSVMHKAAKRPIGYVGSAVMLNARLRQGVSMLHVVALTQALGESLSAADAQPEVYRWTDGSRSHVTCRFRHGKLLSWTLFRPEDGNAGEGADCGPPQPRKIALLRPASQPKETHEPDSSLDGRS